MAIKGPGQQRWPIFCHLLRDGHMEGDIGGELSGVYGEMRVGNDFQLIFHRLARMLNYKCSFTLFKENSPTIAYDNGLM